MPDESPKRLIVVGDRVLIAPEEGEERTNVGLYLPPTAIESRQVQGGRVVATGPGTTRCSFARPPWRSRSRERSIWSPRRRQSSCSCGKAAPRNWSKPWPNSDGPGAGVGGLRRKACGE